MKSKSAWLVLILVTLFSVYSLYKTDVNYLDFVKAADKVKITVREGRVEPQKERVMINFELEIENPSPILMWLEAANYKLHINGQYAGYYYMPEAIRGEILIPPGEKRSIPLKAELRAGYMELFLQAKEGEKEGEDGRVKIVIGVSEGRARTKFDIGRTGLKAFYPFGGIIIEIEMEIGTEAKNEGN